MIGSELWGDDDNWVFWADENSFDSFKWFLGSAFKLFALLIFGLL